MLPATFTKPVEALRDKPIVELNCPPWVKPLAKAGPMFAKLLQIGELKENIVLVAMAGLIVMVVVEDPGSVHP